MTIKQVIDKALSKMFAK